MIVNSSKNPNYTIVLAFLFTQKSFHSCKHPYHEKVHDSQAPFTPPSPPPAERTTHLANLHPATITTTEKSACSLSPSFDQNLMVLKPQHDNSSLLIWQPFCLHCLLLHVTGFVFLLLLFNFMLFCCPPGTECDTN